MGKKFTPVEDLNELNEEEYIVPTFSGQMEHLKDESLMLFSYSVHNKKRYRLFYGIGVVYRVVKGEKQDLVYINFGLFQEHQRRLVVVYENHARRQLLTLKRGQVCHVYGVCRYYKTDVEVNGYKTKGIKLGLYARAIMGWYVPTAFDLKKMPVNEDVVAASEKEEELIDLLTQLENEQRGK